jgi:hypothetical protein
VKNMANDAYKLLQDTSLAKPLRTAVTVEGVTIEETQGQAYAAGQYVLAEELTEATREQAENGELDSLLEPADLDEALAARQAVETGLFIPEHEVERYALLEAGHRVVEKDQVLDLRSAGAEPYQDALKESKKGPHDANPAITEQDSFVEVPDIQAAQNDGEAVLPGEGKQDEVSEFDLVTAPSSSDAGVEMPPGLPVGPVLEVAEGGDAEKVTERVEKSATKKATRAKPGSSGGSGSGSGSGGSGSGS